MNDTKDAVCIRMRIDHGFDYTLVVGDKIYALKGDKYQIDKFAGRKVRPLALWRTTRLLLTQLNSLKISKAAE